MKSASDWLEIIKQKSKNAGDGKWLEDLVCDIACRVPEWNLKKAMKWQDWHPANPELKSSNKDLGIDIVGERYDGSNIAIQCKARQNLGGGSRDSTLTIADLKTFIAITDNTTWVEKWVVTNVGFANNLHQQNLSRDENNRIKIVDFITAVEFLVRLEDERHESDDELLTQVQDKAVRDVVNGLKAHEKTGRKKWKSGESRGRLIMPCGTGKTRVSYRVTTELVNAGEIFVVLVPSIALVSQIKRDYQTLARRFGVSMRTLAVCSDKTAGITESRFSDNMADIVKNPTADVSHTHTYEIVGETATNSQQVKEWIEKQTRNDAYLGLIGLFSTYQSAHNTASGLRETNRQAKLLICDEAHRTAGFRRIKKDNEEFRNFTLCHDSEAFPAKYRLYQTATPRIFQFANTKHSMLPEDDADWNIKSMDDVDTFGYEMYRLSYKDAVEKDLLSDYRIIGWGMGDEDIHAGQQLADELNSESKEKGGFRWTKDLAMRVLMLAAFLAGAHSNNESDSVRSVIAFLNRVKFSKEIAKAINSESVQKWLETYFKRLGVDKNPNEFLVEHVDASHSITTRNKHLRKLAGAQNSSPYCISNVGIFGEGTDSPDLSAVAFLAPRRSPVDVIQAVGRAMRKSKHKNFGYILVPVFIPPGRDAEIFLSNSNPNEGWEELGQILLALRAHDGRIEDKLKDLFSCYIPPPPVQNQNYDRLVVYKEPYKQEKVFMLRTNLSSIESVVAPLSENDKSSVLERIKQNTNKFVEYDDLEKIPDDPPRSLTAVRVDKEGSVYTRDFSHKIPLPDHTADTKWNQKEVVREVKEYLKKDEKKKKRTLIKVKPRPHGRDSYGQLLVKIGGDQLIQSGIHFNLLEKSGILSGATRDVNLLQNIVKTAARKLREEGLEDVLAPYLDMQSVAETSNNTNTADACTVAAIIWTNAVIMQARLEKSNIKELSKMPKVEDIINDVVPARPLMRAWTEVLTKDYKPIFKTATDLLQEVAFQKLEGVSDALHWIAKESLKIADDYANLGMDHAGELFNKVMGNQKSDGAFFTQPLAAAMLAEAALQSGIPKEFDWLDEENWDQLLTFDPACGSGTILVAMLTAIKRRLIDKGADETKLKRFHKYAVENLMIGADINPVSLQLAGCQLTLGDLSADYDKLNLNLMEYGAEKTGSVELLTDLGILPPKQSMLDVRVSQSNLKLDQKLEIDRSYLGDDLINRPPKFILMNPPFTSWRDVGIKFNEEIHKNLRKRLSVIWDGISESETYLKSKKSSISLFFELLGLKLAEKSKGVFGMVMPSTILTAESRRDGRKLLAKYLHLDTVITCHHPNSFNMSWNTNINECLLIFSAFTEQNQNSSTRFINLYRFPSNLEEAIGVIAKAVQGDQFNGSSELWDYQLVRNGDWTPGVFPESEMVKKFHRAINSNEHLRTDLFRRGGVGRCVTTCTGILIISFKNFKGFRNVQKSIKTSGVISVL